MQNPWSRHDGRHGGANASRLEHPNGGRSGDSDQAGGRASCGVWWWCAMSRERASAGVIAMQADGWSGLSGIGGRCWFNSSVPIARNHSGGLHMLIALNVSTHTTGAAARDWSTIRIPTSRA